MRCHEFGEIADSYLCDELLVETNHEVLRHLENCVNCRQELAARRNLQSQLRVAVKNAAESQMSGTFVRKLTNVLQTQGLRPPFWKRLMSGGASFSRPAVWATAMTMAACLIIGLWFGTSWLRNADSSNQIAANRKSQIAPPQTLPKNDSSEEVEAVRAAWSEVSRQAAGDHQNCALKFNLAENPISLAEAAEKYGKFNRNLEKAVVEPLREAFGDKIKLAEAHSCVFQGRRFAHVVLKERDKTISVLVTKFDLNNEPGDAITCDSGAQMRVACFRTAHHAIFVVSDLPESENLTIARTISTTVRRHLDQTERAA